ncbi:MAG: AMP-binding protein [Bacteroidota bacterium]
MSQKFLVEYFYQHEKEKANQPFLHQPFGDTWETYTWAEVGEKARRLATWLKKQCPKEKAHISIVSKNCREWFIADIATMMAGFVSVPFYPNLKGEQLNEIIKLGDVDLLLIGKVDGWEDMKTGIPEDMKVGKFPHYEDFPKIDIGTDWDTIMKEAPIQENYVPKAEDIWSIIFTSGTTGTPKGAYFTEDKLRHALNHPSSAYWFMLDEKKENRFFSYLPLNHIAERTVEFLGIRFGVEIFFSENLSTFAQNMKDAKPTLFLAVPRIWTKFKQGVLAKMPQEKLDRLLRLPFINAIVKRKLKAALGLEKARICITGAAPMTSFDKAWWMKLGVPLSEAYGQTESLGYGCYSPVGGFKSGTIGKAHQGFEVKIDADTNEILFKFPMIMNGYYKDEGKTAETIRNGWLHTSDAGAIDSEGYISIIGRVKDTFKTEKGEFIIPTKVEHQYSPNADIEQMCLLGLGMPQPVMIVVPSEGGAAKPKSELEKSLEATRMQVNSGLENYTRVNTVVIAREPFTTDNGLLTPTLKVKRFNVHAKYANNLRTYAEHKENVIWE